MVQKEQPPCLPPDENTPMRVPRLVFTTASDTPLDPTLREKQYIAESDASLTHTPRPLKEYDSSDPDNETTRRLREQYRARLERKKKSEV